MCVYHLDLGHTSGSASLSVQLGLTLAPEQKGGADERTPRLANRKLVPSRHPDLGPSSEFSSSSCRGPNATIPREAKAGSPRGYYYVTGPVCSPGATGSHSSAYASICLSLSLHGAQYRRLKEQPALPGIPPSPGGIRDPPRSGSRTGPTSYLSPVSGGCR